jgi:cyclic pyranopterin phosphate synthase
MPEEGIKLRDKNEFMSEEELLAIVQIFVDYGVNKIRLTGGEPLIKKNFRSILMHLAELPVELAITTNAVLLDRFMDDLWQAGVRKLNISIDSLDAESFNRITRRKDFHRIFGNIQKAHDYGFEIKLNCVLMRDVNENEINDFIALTSRPRMHVRFIEFMPFDGNNWDWSKKVSETEILKSVKQGFGAENIHPVSAAANSTSRNYKITGFNSTFGIISTLTNPFCDTCNRIRLTADGKIKNCLFSANETDLLTNYRNGQDIRPLIEQTIKMKAKKRAGINSFDSKEGAEIFNINRSMTTIGG